MIFSEDNYCLNCKGTGCKDYGTLKETCRFKGAHCDLACMKSQKELIMFGCISCYECFKKCKYCQGEGTLIWIDFIVKNLG